MSQNKSSTYINIASFKLNRISLFNQSELNPFLRKVQKKNTNINIFKPGNIVQKINPLSKKDKIIKRHNILKKIDFYDNNKTFNEKNNYNNSKELSLINSKSPSQGNNVHLPFLVYNNNLKIFQNLKKNKNIYNNRINLFKNYNVKNSNSYIFNSLFLQNKLYHLNNHQNESKKILKPNYTDKEIQTGDDIQIRTINGDKNEINISKININNNNYNNNYNNNSLYKINIKSKKNLNEKKDDDSSDDLDYKNEIEKIMATKSKSHIRNLQEIGDYFFRNNIKKIDSNEYKNYILLKSLYKLKNSKNEKFSSTEQNMIVPNIKLKKINKNIFNKIRNNKIKKNLSQNEERLINFKQYKKKIIPKSYIYHLLNQSCDFKVKN